jgi:hypothetical protein
LCLVSDDYADRGAGSHHVLVTLCELPQLLPKKCHIVVMAHIKHIGRIIWWRGTDPTVSTSSAPVSEADPSTSLPSAAGDAAADKWVDELQWLSGFPTGWGERRGGWFSRF